MLLIMEVGVQHKRNYATKNAEWISFEINNSFKLDNGLVNYS